AMAATDDVVEALEAIDDETTEPDVASDVADEAMAATDDVVEALEAIDDETTEPDVASDVADEAMAATDDVVEAAESVIAADLAAGAIVPGVDGGVALDDSAEADVAAAMPEAVIEQAGRVPPVGDIAAEAPQDRDATDARLEATTDEVAASQVDGDAAGKGLLEAAAAQPEDLAAEVPMTQAAGDGTLAEAPEAAVEEPVSAGFAEAEAAVETPSNAEVFVAPGDAEVGAEAGAEAVDATEPREEEDAP
ncbi:MAG: hypothetical protein OEZ06_06300, partial [Myxococcales bacterium]|nr:hypothetical protein [Myxococcales bacterium]